MGVMNECEGILEDRREERFCEYLAVEGYTRGSAYQRAFRDDCGLERVKDAEAIRGAYGLLERPEIKGRIMQIRRLVKGGGALTQEVLLGILESRLLKTAKDMGGSARDRLSVAKTLATYTAEIRKMRGWDKKKEDSTLTIHMERVFPEGYKPVEGESLRVDMDFTVKAQNEAVLSQEKGKSKDDEIPELATEEDLDG